MNLVSGLMKVLYMPVCRAYARHVLGDKPADPIYRFLCSLQFRQVQGFWPNFVQPRRFSEKRWSRMLHDRNPLLIALSDKVQVRDYIASKVGSQHLIPLLWSGTKPDDIPFDDLPSKFVIKANHGCGYNIIVRDKAKLDRASARLQLQRWLGENFCRDKYLGSEWAYKDIRPSIIVEAFMEENGKPPADYKFWCFSGRTEFVTIHRDRFEDHRIHIVDRDFNPVELAFPHVVHSTTCPSPENFSEMRSIAESVAAGFGFMRIDLYNVNGRVYFGEITAYPGGVAKLFDAEPDLVVGQKWPMEQDV